MSACARAHLGFVQVRVHLCARVCVRASARAWARLCTTALAPQNEGSKVQRCRRVLGSLAFAVFLIWVCPHSKQLADERLLSCSVQGEAKRCLVEHCPAPARRCVDHVGVSLKKVQDALELKVLGLLKEWERLEPPPAREPSGRLPASE